MRRVDFGSSVVSLFSLVHAIFGVMSGGRRQALYAGVFLLAATGSGLAFLSSAVASPALVVDAATGDVLFAEEATEPWYPASVTKLMTFYLALSAVRDHKISLDTPIVISARAARAVPSKMGFKPGTEVTLGNALKMMIVKSANDIAIAVAEGVAGSVEAFAEDMNATAAKLGMEQSHFVNPNGLPDPEHVSSAHDLAVLARAIYLTFPDSAGIFAIGSLRLGDEIILTHNTLLGRYPGVDGMKTGFTCAAGFNLIASAQSNGHRYITVVLGAPNVHLRMLKTAVLLDRAFAGIDHPIGKLDTLAAGGSSAAPDMHNSICRRRSKAAAAYQAQINQLEAPLTAETKPASRAPSPLALFTGGAALMKQATPIAPTLALVPAPVFEPVPVYVGPAPGYQGPVAEARLPHSPVGTAPLPETVGADAGTKPQELATAPDSSLKRDVASLPLKGHHKISRHRTAKAEATKEETVTSAVAAEKTSLKQHSFKRSHSGKRTRSAAKLKKHLHKHIASKGGVPKAKSTRMAAKVQETSGAGGKPKGTKAAAPDPQ